MKRKSKRSLASKQAAFILRTGAAAFRQDGKPAARQGPPPAPRGDPLEVVELPEWLAVSDGGKEPKQ